MTYFVGDLIRLTAQFTSNLTSLPTDPTTVTFFIRDPTGAIATQSPSTSGVGVWYYDQLVGIGGQWRWRATGTGAVQVVGEGNFSVANPSF